MLRIILKILTFTLPWIVNPSVSQEIWKENFNIPGKGVWCDRNGNIISDFSEITSWSLDIAGISLPGPDSYAKTVSTSGGRFECRKMTGEVIWLSEMIDISRSGEVNISLTAYETGSGNNTDNKYLKAFYKLDSDNPVMFDKNGHNAGNWGSAVSEQLNLKGGKLQIICKMANHYSNDKVTLDNIQVWHEQKPLPPLKKQEILISEVLFNPFPGGKDYVEICNPSKEKRAVDFLYIANRDKDLNLKQIQSVFNERTELLPESFLVLTTDEQDIIQNYHYCCPGSIYEVDKLPAFNNDEGYVVLLNEDFMVIDEMHYNEKMHSRFLRNYKGVSLERVSMNNPSKANWQSASSASGYGTPGCKNSQQENDIPDSPVVSFRPESFSPNTDGFNDEFIISYSLDKPGFAGNINIYDKSGRFVVSLIKNEILGTTGEIKWDGTDKTGKRQPLGIYIVTVELFNYEGEIYRWKDSVVLTGILD
jgi:hypothetical protein